MPYQYRRGFYQPPQGRKGIGGFQQRYVTVIDEQSADTETDSAMNMTKDVLQGNTLNEDNELQQPIKEKKRKHQEEKKRKAPYTKKPPKKPKVDMSQFNSKYMSQYYKR